DDTLDFLAKGETVTLLANILIDDHNGGTDTSTVTITITGTDDEPVIAAGDKAETGSITELNLTTSSTALDTQSGVIHFSDPDQSDRPTATISSQSATYLAADGHTVLTLTTAQLDAIENALTLTPAGGNTNSGAIDWSYSIVDDALDFLAKGETVTLVSNILLDDHNGGTDTSTVTITITGTDDEPVIAAGDKAETGSITELNLTT